MRIWLKKYINPIVPLYMLVPVILCVTVNWLAYFGVRAVTQTRFHFDFTTAIDNMIPFHPSWALIYVASFPFWIVGYIVIARQGREHWYRYVTAVLMAKVTCGICFLLIPTTNVRPAVTETGFYGWLINLIYSMDTPTELFPSIHCLESWFCYIGVRGQEKVPKAYRYFACLFAVLICASTQFTKQHYLVDIPAALLLAEASYYIARKTNLFRVIQKPGQKIEMFLFQNTEQGE